MAANPFLDDESANPFADESAPATPSISNPPISVNPFSDSFPGKAEHEVAAAADSLFNPFDGESTNTLGGGATPAPVGPKPGAIALAPSRSDVEASTRPAAPTRQHGVAPATVVSAAAALAPVAAVPAEHERIDPIEVIRPTFESDMLMGCAQLLASGRHADLAFQLADGSLAAHRMIFETRCGTPFVKALEAGAFGPVSMDQGWCLAVKLSGSSAAAVGSLLRFLYTEQFAPAGRSAAVALLQLIARFEEATADAEPPADPTADAPPHQPNALRRLRQLCEQELSQLVDSATVVDCAHEAARIGARQLLTFCLQYMRAHFDALVARGALKELHTPLCAQLFQLRSDAPLQDAFELLRPDVAEYFLLQPDNTALASMINSADARRRSPLEVALAKGSIEAATLLLAKGANVDAIAGGSDEPLLHTVCAHSDAKADSSMLRKAALLLSHGAAVDAMNSRGESTLDASFFRGTPAAVKLLLHHGATSTMTTAASGSLLHAAAEERRDDVLVTGQRDPNPRRTQAHVADATEELALASLGAIGLQINQQDSAGRTPLHVAVAAAAETIIAQLLRMHADTELIADDGSTALSLAVLQDDVDTTAALLQAGANKDAVSVDGLPLIVLACDCGVDVALALVRAGADPNKHDADGRTALDIAMHHDELGLCEELLSKGARPTKRQETETGNTALHTAVLRRAESLVRLLVRNKAELSIQNLDGCTPLLIAAASGQDTVVELLLHSSSALHLVDSSNRSALELALQAGHLSTLTVLLQQSSVDVNGITKRGSSLLHFAAEIGDDARINFLLSMNAQVDMVNPNGETPLHWACSLGQLNVVRCLVQHGADPLLHERVQGLTPLHASCSARGQPAVLAVLIQRCEFTQWNSQPQRCNLLDFGRNTPLHTCIKLAPHAAKYVPILIEHGSNPNLQNGAGQTALHLLAERAVRELQQRTAVAERPSESEEREGGAADGAAEGAGAPRSLPASRILDNLAELTLALDAAEFETGNTALHIAAFGGCIELAEKLVRLGASVGLPNKDGFTPLDSMQPSGVDGKSLQELLLTRISKPSSWTPDRLVSACQQCKLPFNRTNPDMARKHHCRHCGRCTCVKCSPRRVAIPKFGTSQEERVCLLCERMLIKAAEDKAP